MDSTLTTDLLKLLLVALLVFANGFFVAAEFSLVSVRRTRIAELLNQGHSGAIWVQKAIENPDRVIAATQLGITLASLGLGWIGEPALSHLIDPLIAIIPVGMKEGVAHSISAGIAFSIITFLHVVVGELAPKSIALQDPEKTSLVVAQPTLWTERIFKPVIWALNGTGAALLKLVGVHPASGHELVHSVEEIKMLVTASAEEGVVQAEESEMLHAIFDLSQLLARQVMLPRTEIIAIEADTPLDEIVELATQSLHTKFPVYEDNLDQILGILHVKEVLRHLKEPASNTCVARDLAREALFVPENISADALLRQFRASHQHIAIVLDEYGGTAGMVTLEDLLEEIVGEVSDPFDHPHPDFERLPDGTILIEGMTLIEDVNEELHLNLQDPHYDTIAGYILGKLGRMARPGDTIESGDLRLRVESMDGLRIARVALKQESSGAG
jgi:CBS domain containing-hemolysin-like protein